MPTPQIFDQERGPAVWQFNLATFLATQLFGGVEGWVFWLPSALVAWFMNRGQQRRRYVFASVVWLIMMVGLFSTAPSA